MAGEAFDDDPEKDLQKNMGQSKVLVMAIKSKLTRSETVSSEITRLKAAAENIRINDLLIQERFKAREEKAKTLGPAILLRQQSMADGYRAALTEYLSIIDAIPSGGSISQATIRNLQSLLEKILPQRKRPIIGSLPYKHLNYPAQEPNANAPITPAYKGGNKIVSAEDTALTPEAPVSNEIATLAQSLNWNPVSIYEYVKNNIETEWYWGCMKGAGETLHQKSGNDCDQATLMASLLRASGFPTRYVRGVIEFFPDVERAKNLTGIDEPAKIAEFFQKAGIPFKPMIRGGRIDNFQIEHVWVESQIPYANYRGAIIDEHGKTWLGLDTSIKVKDYTYNDAKDILQEPGVGSQLSGIRDGYLGLSSQATSTQPATPLEYLRAFINTQLGASQPGTSYSDYLRMRTIVPEVLNILPASTQFTLMKATNEYTALPDELIHKVRFRASKQSTAGSIQGDNLFDITLPLYKLSNQQIALSYEPETVQDQETIDSYGGLDNTPAYLVRLRPMLKINNERIIVAQDGLPMGADYGLSIELISPNATEKINNTVIAGNLTVIGITAQKAVMAPSPLAGEGGGEGPKDAERLLYESAQHYIDRWNQAEEELASLLHLTIARPIPTVVNVGGVIDVAYLLDTPHGFTWKGVFVDADLRAIEAVHRTPDPGDRTRLFTQLSSLQGSILENRIFEDDFKAESISTAKLFQLANAQPATGILFIDKTNIAAVLPTLLFDDNIKEDITNSVNQNFIIRVPQSEIVYHDWTGTGYIKENSATGESGWMLSGMLVSHSPDVSGIAGGSTVDEAWLNNLYQQTLSTPFAGPVNHDPLAVVRMFKIPKTDKQDPKTVGTALLTPFAVAVLDGNDRPVVGAIVTFRIIAGGGTIQCLNQAGTPTGQPSISPCNAFTSNAGIAKATLTLGVKTDANADYMKLNAGDENYTQIGLNLVAAAAASHSGQVALNAPFEAYGKPDAPMTIEKVYPLNPVFGTVNNPAGSLRSRVTDTHGNPVSNVPLTFHAEDAKSDNPATDPLPLPPATYQKLELYTRETCTNPYPIAGDCVLSSSLTRTTHYYGAQVETLIGNTLNTHYTVTTSAPGLADAAFNLYSRGTRSGDGNYLPNVLMVWGLGTVNEKGEAVNAAKAGSDLKAPLAAKMFLLHDDSVVSRETCTKLDSSGNTITYSGYSIMSQNTVTIKPITNGTVTFATLQGSGTAAQTQNMGDGLYQASYRTGAQPAKNIIEANGSALVYVWQIYAKSQAGGGYGQKTRCLETPIIQVPATLQHGETALFDETTNELARVYDVFTKPTYTAFGVNATLDIQPALVLLNDQGFTTTDMTLTYTILPPEYSAIRADLDSYKTGLNNIETWEGSVVADKTKGKGQVTFVAGTPFDITQLYREQVVLNRGTDMEVRGEKKEIPVAQISVKKGQTLIEADEIKFGDGSRPEKKYYLDILSRTLVNDCASLTGKISIVDKNGQTITVPGAQNEYFLSEYPLDFPAAFFGGCKVRIKDMTDNGNLDQYVVLSNKSRATLSWPFGFNPDLIDTTVLYGGIGNIVKIEIDGAKKYLPIEPVGIIVIGIDGLRQDVLYPVGEQQVNELHGNYYVQPSELKGLCDVLGGKLGGTCDTTGWEKRHIKLKEVTAIFPSITLASWASIFTGKMPNETGITGNEFFAKDLYTNGQGMPSKRDGSLTPILNPAGIVSFDSGAFKGYDIVGPGSNDFFIPWQFNWKPTMNPAVTPQNDTRVLTAGKTLFESISEMQGVQNYVNDKGADAVTVAYSHYARGASNWLTFNYSLTSLSWTEASTLDKASWSRFEEYLKGKFLTNNVRNTVPFSPLTVWYLSGLDHKAHKSGMDTYKTYFTDTTDDYIWDLTKWLKNFGEFDNKIFVIVADHGHTAMPTDLTYKSKWLGIDVDKTAEMSCAFKADFGNTGNPNKRVQKAERNNNNLHVWELGELFSAIGGIEGALVRTKYKLLAPDEIEKFFLNSGVPDEFSPTSTIDEADVVAALNGPMAHIYSMVATDNKSLGEIAEAFRIMLSGSYPDEAVKWFGFTDQYSYAKFRVRYAGRLRNSVDKILIRLVDDKYYVFDGLDVNGDPIAYGLSSSLVGLEYVDGENRVNGMNNKNRSGDIVLIMKDDVNYPASESIADHRYTSGVSCKSWHGSLNRSDSYVPFIFAYPGGNSNELEQILKKNSLCKSNYSECKANWKLPDIVKEIVSMQFK